MTCLIPVNGEVQSLSPMIIAASDKVRFSTFASCKKQELLNAVSIGGKSVPSIVCLQFKTSW